MSGNIQLVRDLNAAFGRGDIPYILKRVAEDVDWRHSRSSDIP